MSEDNNVAEELEHLRKEIAELKRFFIEDLKDIIQEELSRCLNDHERELKKKGDQRKDDNTSKSSQEKSAGESEEETEIEVKEEPEAMEEGLEGDVDNETESDEGE